MSTEGDGKACQLAAVLGLKAAAEAGIMLDKGVMWVGDKLWQNFEKEQRHWQHLRDAIDAHSNEMVRTISGFVVKQVDSTIMQSFADSVEKTVDPAALRTVMAQARNALDDAGKVARTRAETERNMLIAQLSEEIRAARGILPEDVIWQAELVLRGSNPAMHDALRTLERAWNTKATLQSYQERQHRQIKRVLDTVSRQLAIASNMAKDTSEADQKTFVGKRKAIEALRDSAITTLKHDADGAMRQAEKAREAAHAFTREVSACMLEAWDSVQGEMNAVRGTLVTLEKLVQEAASITITTKSQNSQLTKRITTLFEEIEAVASSEPGTVRRRIAMLRERAELLKQEVLTTIQRKQQSNIAETIADVLDELGFVSTHGRAPKVKANGDLLCVEALHMASPGAIGRDDKAVTFDISRQGDIAYDFVGYVGDACIPEAERIFAALRARGLYILDADAARRLQNSSVKNITAEMLNHREFQPQLDVNKVQAKLAERLHAVLEQMNYAHVTQSVVGGCVELEAFNGPVGYRVILTPEGSAQVLKDKHYIDVSADRHDPVVSEALYILEQEDNARPGSPPSYRFQQPQQPRKNTYKGHRQQSLEN